jgi:two-component system LytT family response regulator
MNCLIVDDEPIAVDVIKVHLEKIPFVNIVGQTTSALEAIEIINSNAIDVLFLDIQMPELTGIELLNSLQQQPMVIFTTAYPDYAIKSYDFDTVDYLMKPISFNAILTSVNKANARLAEKISEPAPTTEFIFVKTAYKTVKILLSEIYYLESTKDYVTFHLEDVKIKTQLTLSSIEEQLPSKTFVRIHRSYIIAIDKINEIERNTLLINGDRLSIGTNYKTEFKRLIETKRLA